MNNYVRWDCPNKKVIKKENKKGDFTTVNYGILRNKNLSSNAKILFIEILSDSEDFRFSEQLYIKRIGFSKTTYYRAIDNLIDIGYIKKKKIKDSQYNYYIISEFGNLKSDDEVEVSIEQLEKSPEKSNQKKVKSKDVKKVLEGDNLEKLNAYIKSVGPLLSNPEISKGVTELLKEVQKNKISDYYEFKTKSEKIIISVKKKTYKNMYDEMKRKLNSTPKRFQNIYTDYLKTEIFDKNNLVFNYKNKFLVKNHLYMSKYHYKPDPESLAADRADGV